MTDAPTLAKRVTLHRDGIDVDGQRLPFHVGEEVTVVRSGEQVTGVTVTIMCEEVTLTGLSTNARVWVDDPDDVIDVEVVSEHG